MKIIRSEMAPIGNIGQMNVEMAPKEIERLEELTGLTWRTDFSDIMITRDDPGIDENARGWHKISLTKGNCWVICEKYTHVIS